MPHPIGVMSQSILYPFSISQTCPMSFLKLAQKCVPGRTCPGRFPYMSRTCPQNVPVLTILGHLQIVRVQLSLGLYFLRVVGAYKIYTECVPGQFVRN